MAVNSKCWPNPIESVFQCFMRFSREIEFWYRVILWVLIQNVKHALGVSSQFFFIWTRVLNHNKYVEIKQFSKVDIKQNNISTVILLIKFLVYQWNLRHFQGSWVVYIFVYIMKFVFYYLITFMCVSIIRIRFNLIIMMCTKNYRVYG